MPKSTKVTFQNKEGITLSARLEMPIHQIPFAYAIFAHCFTCSKNLGAVRHISQALTKNGIAVLRFDFTGLGDSEGDFADTNFSSNVGDLIAAAQFLEQEYEAPTLLVGHSLGGAAVIFASAELDSVKAVATIGAPANPEHVSHLLAEGSEDLVSKGIAKVNIGGRPFTVKKQFIDDIKSQKMEAVLPDLRKSLLIMHSPQDRTVFIENARKLYQMAHHPKSFISLDGADHLLTNKADSLYIGEAVASWAKRYLDVIVNKPLKTSEQVAVSLFNEDIFTTQVVAGKHRLVADEPESIGGNDFGASPYELVSAGLGACTAMTMQMYARRKKWDVEEVIVHINHGKRHAEDCKNCEDPKSKLDHFDRTIEIKGDLDETQRQRLLEIANKCPVHRTLESEIRVETELKDA